MAMFWGGTDRKRASSCLRTALHMLRRDLAPLGDTVLRADRNAVWLEKDRIHLREPAQDGGQFLEGMDLDLDSCDAFEEWLRDMRLRRATSEHVEADAGDDAASHQSPNAKGPQYAAPSIGSPAMARPLALGLLPALHAPLSAADNLRVTSAMDAVARSLMGVSWLVLHDLRGSTETIAMLPVETGRGPTHLLEPLVERHARQLILTLRLRDAASRLVWISKPTPIRADETEEIAASVSEKILDHLAAGSVDADVPDLFPWTALTALFSLDVDAIRRTERQVARMRETGAHPVISCIGHFAQVFKENEGVETSARITREELCDLVASVPASDPMLPLWQSLAGYCAHMLIGDNDLATAFLDAAQERSPTLPLNLDHIAVLRMSLGDLKGAEEAFRRCQRVGVGSPWRYTYDVTGAMLHMSKGDYRASLHFANQALLRKPRFIGALRYAMAGFALAGNIKDASMMQARLLRLRPEYDMGRWLEGMARRSPGEIGRTLSQTFQKNGFV
jgi:tetratricopeptide (TPR) repeat protein